MDRRKELGLTTDNATQSRAANHGVFTNVAQFLDEEVAIQPLSCTRQLA